MSEDDPKIKLLIEQVRSKDDAVARRAFYSLDLLEKLSDGSLKGIDFSSINLSGAILGVLKLSNANFSGADLTEFWVGENSEFTNCNFSGANIPGAFLQSTSARGAIFDGANLSSADLPNDLEGASFNNANLEHATIGYNLRSCSFRGANLQHASGSGCIFDGSDLTNADLRGATLEGASLRNTILDGAKFDHQTQLPDGSFWTEDTDLSTFQKAQ